MAPKGGTDVEKTNDKKLDDKKNIKDAKEDFPEDTDLSEEDQQLKLVYGRKPTINLFENINFLD